MPRSRLVLLTLLTLVAFAANSLLCRAALDVEGMDAVSFTLVRLASGAVVLLGLLAKKGRVRTALASGSWVSGAVLLGYALLFSLAYRSIPAGVGALVLFAAVQLTMLAAAVRVGAGPLPLGWVGVVAALGGLIGLTVPGAQAPDPVGVALMAGSGISWGIYSLRGRGSTRPAEDTAVGFCFATALVLPACLAWLGPTPASVSARGLGLAVTSGAVTSGLGYVLWYAVLPHLATARAAVLQLSVPVIAAAAGAVLLGEAVTSRLVLSSAAILGGIALVLRFSRRVDPAAR
jgi:drug/metabolite transporter (DMT)-like permease